VKVFFYIYLSINHLLQFINTFIVSLYWDWGTLRNYIHCSNGNESNLSNISIMSKPFVNEYNELKLEK